MKIDRKYIDRFWQKVDIKDKNECWEWTAAKHEDRAVCYDGKQVMNAARFMAKYIMELEIDGLVVRHKCDNPGCVNPSHLETGTHRDNSNDRVSRNRQARGETQGLSKLTEADVLYIREQTKTRQWGTAVRLAKELNVSESTISRVINRETWTHVDYLAIFQEKRVAS